MAEATSNDASLWNQHSPLDTLVRRTSSKRFKQRTAVGYVDQQGGQGYGGYNEQYDESAAYDYNPPEPSTPERNGSQQLATSPLLHSHFARHSTATSSSNGDNSYYIDRSSMGSAATDGVYPPYQYDDDASVYSDAPALRESWQSTTTARLTQTGNTTINEIPGARAPPRSPSPNETMPVVVVSSPGGGQTARPVSKGGRAPIAASAQLTANFSRPVRPPTLPPVNAEEQKRLVLERNAARARSPSNPSPQPNQFSTLQQLPPLPRGSSTSSMGSHPSSSAQAQDYGAPPYLTDRSISSHSYRPPSPNAYINPQAPASLRSVASSPNLNPMAGPSRPPQSAPLSRGAPDGRSGSPTSVYSGYSFYQLPPTPSNELPQPQLQLSQGNASRARSPQPAPPPTITVTPSPSYQSHAPAPPGPPNLDNPQTPQDYLQLGIQAHEANKLRDSFDHFEQAAKLQGGCGVGMLMYGLSLRHGWGCEKNEKVGFKWLRRAAESAVEDLESARASKMMDVGAVQSELVLAIYEVGQCFFQGWGVPKDQKMAVSYYRVAARLGDPDAQQDLGFCLANGKGCKKDKKEAAKWYRAAVAQGISDVGLAWIFKEKYQ